MNRWNRLSSSRNQKRGTILGPASQPQTLKINTAASYQWSWRASKTRAPHSADSKGTLITQSEIKHTKLCKTKTPTPIQTDFLKDRFRHMITDFKLEDISRTPYINNETWSWKIQTASTWAFLRGSWMVVPLAALALGSRCLSMICFSWVDSLCRQDRERCMIRLWKS